MKNRFVALLFALFLGSFGLHKFYLGHILGGIMYLIFSWTGIPTILSFIDVILLATMDERKFNVIYNHQSLFRQRSQWFHNAAQILEDRQQEFAALMTLEYLSSSVFMSLTNSFSLPAT